MSTTRFEIRLSSETKQLIEQAAELRNQTLTQFVIATLSDAATKVLAEHQRTVLSDRDRDLFLKLLDAPPTPNGALRNATENYRERSKGSF
jgi:uncharacterized protein (DUF1778 family)